MKILILTDEYLPESTRNHARMMHDLAKKFTLEGHNVSVLTPGSSNQSRKIIQDIFEDVQVLRFRTPQIRHKSNAVRAFREFLLAFNALSGLKAYSSNFDYSLCVNYSPTIFFGLVARKVKKNGGFVYLVLRDFFPQWIIDNKIISKFSVAALAFKIFEYLNYQSSNIIGVQSPANQSAFYKMIKYKCPPTEVLYNWSIGLPSNINKDFGSKFLNSNNIDAEVILFYGGNIGSAQDMQNIVRLCANIRSYKNAHVLLVGQGNQFQMVTNLKEEMGLKNLTIQPSITQAQYASLLLNVSVGLFSLSQQHTAHNFPGKLLGYMAAGIPILGSVNNSNDLKDLVNNKKAGLVTDNGDDVGFANNAISLISSKNKRDEMGKAANNLLSTTFSTDSAANKILGHLI